MGRQHSAQRHARDDDESDGQALVGLSTDPTDTNSVFTAMISMVDGKPVVEWSPKLSAAEESRRRYTIYGRAGLESGEEWHSPTNALDRFFTVGVEMK